MGSVSNNWTREPVEAEGDVFMDGDIMLEVGQYESASDMLELVGVIDKPEIADEITHMLPSLTGVRIHVHGRRKRTATLRIWLDDGVEYTRKGLFVSAEALELCEVAG